MSDIEKQKLFILIGIPGSGKTTLSKNMIESLNSDAVHISRDAIRKEVGEKTFSRKSEAKVFKTYVSRIATALKLGYDVIADATNLSKDNRIIYFALCEALQKAGLADVEILGIHLSTPLSVCIERNDSREDKVPKELIESMCAKIEEPSYDEGFKVIMNKS